MSVDLLDSHTESGQRRGILLPALYAVAAVVLLLDQLTKALVVRALTDGQQVAILGHLLSITRRHNTGAAFGVFSSGTTFLIFAAVLVIAILIVFGRQIAAENRLLGFAVALQLGGAAGNLLDRARLGYVVDFIDVHFWPVFNIADIGITVGALLMVWALLFHPDVRKSATDT